MVGSGTGRVLRRLRLRRATAPSSRSTRVSGSRCPSGCRIVDARYLAPDIPAETPPRFGVADGCAGDPGQRPRAWEGTPSQYVVVGSGKTATDACVWLLARGVDPDAICWVRPRDPWMLNRALIQPDPVIYLGMVADMMRLAASGRSLPDLFLAAGGRRDHAAHRPLGDADDGQGAHPRHVGARPAAHHRERRPAAATSTRVAAAGSTSRRDRSPSPTTPWS